MKPFRYRRGDYLASISVAEADLLTNLVGQLQTLLATRQDQGGADPLAELTGLLTGPSTAPSDPAMARLVPDFHRDDAEMSAGLRMLREPEVLAAKSDAVRIFRATVPAGGGTIRLTEPQARAWLVAIGDIRLILGTRLGITDEEPPAAARASASGPEHAMYLTYQWLTVIQESLVQAMLEMI